MADERAKLSGPHVVRHLERLRGLRATREFRRSSRILGPICEALEYLMDSDSPAPPADDDETSTGEELPRRTACGPETDEPAEVDPLIVQAEAAGDMSSAVMGSWSVALEQPAPPPPESRAERLAAREKAVRKRLNSKAGEAEAAARVKRVMANTAGPAMVPGRVSSPTSPETAAALREVGRDGRPASFAINLYV